jgi:AraC family transcriptional regulator
MFAFGRQLRAAFAMPRAPVLEARDLSFGPLAVTELRYDGENYGTSAPLQDQDAMLVSLQLRASLKHKIWEDGKLLPPSPLAAGMTSIYDLRRAVTAHSVDPYHCLCFTFPIRTLDESTEDLLYRFELGHQARLALSDPVIEALGAALLPVMAHPEKASRLFVDHVLFALRAHVASRFGAGVDRFTQPGGLTSWQVRRASEFIDANLAGDISLADVARECQLSVAQFARSFRRSTGRPPHRYLTERRVERAQNLLLHSDLPLAEVAVRCGFADQSHFTKVFRRLVGVSPGSLRGATRSKPR